MYGFNQAKTGLGHTPSTIPNSVFDLEKRETTKRKTINTHRHIYKINRLTQDIDNSDAMISFAY